MNIATEPIPNPAARKYRFSLSLSHNAVKK